MGKEMLYKDGLLSLKIVSEQSTISGRINSKYFVVLRRRSLPQFSEKIQKHKAIFKDKEQMNFVKRLTSELTWFSRISRGFQCTGNCSYHAKCYSTDPRRRRPPMVTDEVPVDRTKYSDVLIKLNGYDPAVLTSFYHYVNQAARNMKFDVSKKFSLATEAFSVTLANPPHFFREKNMQYHFKNHGRMIQIESIPSEMADIFLQCVQKNIPPGVTIEFELKKWQDFVSPPSQKSSDIV